MYDLTAFTPNDMYDCAIALRNMDAESNCTEVVAERMVRYLHQKLIDPRTREPACALVRFFRTYAYGQLEQELQQAAQQVIGNRTIANHTKCLTLLATAGAESYWNSRYESTGHKAIPLVDRDFVERAPMISQLIQQFGLDINTVLQATPEVLVDVQRTTFNVFYIPKALGSAHIPAQKEFVVPYQINSVLGFGGLLTSGDLFAVILFTKVAVPPPTAHLFKWISSYARIAVDAVDPKAAFANRWCIDSVLDAKAVILNHQHDEKAEATVIYRR